MRTPPGAAPRPNRTRAAGQTDGKDFCRAMPIATLPAPAGTVCCAVRAYAALRVPAEAVAALRRPRDPRTGEPLPPALLKNADDQTVAALAAVCRAIEGHALGGCDFTAWGVVAAPRFLGRAAMGHVLHRFRQEGAWGISPHLIPHRSLHAVSGTLSLALDIRGPNFGVGGGPGADSEGLAVAAALVAGGDLPGVWAVLTGYDPEVIPPDPAAPSGEAGGLPAPPCTAVALALTSPGPQAGGLFLEVGQPGARTPGTAAGSRPFTLAELGAALEGCGSRTRWELSCGGWVELKRVAGENRL